MMKFPKILLVDDRDENLVALDGLLRSDAAETLRARSGQEALELLLIHEVALALIDVQMPDMDGLELAELMRGAERTREIPIIFITAGLHDRTRIFKGYETGAVDFLLKPVDPFVLKSKVEVFLQLARHKQQLGERVRQLEEALTDRERSERALRESEQRFRVLAEGLPQPIWSTDANGRSDYVNSRWTKFTGLGLEQSRGGAWFEVVHPEDAPATRARWLHSIQTGEAFECEHRLRRCDGQYRWHSSRGFAQRNDAGEITHWFGTSTDIHDIKEAEAVLRDVDRRKNEFIAVLSHELRNPLAPIHNSLHILERVSPGSGQARRAREVIQRQVAQLTRLVDDLLDLTRVARNKIVLKKERFDLIELMTRTAEDQRSLFDANGVRLDLEVASAPLPLLGDPARLAQAIGNLLQNAAKFTPPGGRALLRVARDEASGRARILVRDSGVGMDERTLSRVFEPFVQADASLDRSRGGLGLGLALVRNLVELHGGQVEARSDGPGHGSEFVVLLPLGAPEAAVSSPASTGAASAPRRVLLIEDNVDSAESLRDILELNGHEVEIAFTGPEGIEVAREFRPGLVLCDIGLPGMDGYEVARTLAQLPVLSGTRLVALSGYALPEDLRRSAAAGFHRHLAKPVSLQALEEVLRA